MTVPGGLGQDLGDRQDDHADSLLRRTRRTSKSVKEVVDKEHLPVCHTVVLSLSRSFWDDSRHDTAAEKLQFVIRQLTLMKVWHHHTW
jgi:hypothetical protein